jgi:hypothetical protein
VRATVHREAHLEKCTVHKCSPSPRAAYSRKGNGCRSDKVRYARSRPQRPGKVWLTRTANRPLPPSGLPEFSQNSESRGENPVNSSKFDERRTRWQAVTKSGFVAKHSEISEIVVGVARELRNRRFPRPKTEQRRCPSMIAQWATSTKPDY